jgi:integrase
VKYPYTRSYRDRHGKLRIEYRRGGRTIPLRATPGTAEFQAAYDAAKVLFAGAEISAAPAQPHSGTLRWLSVEYFKSAEFEQLAPSTQRARRLVFEGMLQEPTKPNAPFLFADCPLGRFTPEHVKLLRDRKKGFPEAANIRLKALRGLFKWAIDNGKGGVTKNPARDVPRLKVREDGYHAWSAEEREQFERRHPVGTKARLAYALLFYTGQRRSDVVLFGRQHVHSGKLRFTQQKNRRRKPITLELPILPELQEILDASPVGDLTFLVTAHGRSFAVAGFGNWFRERCNEAGLPHCTSHGLRKAAATVAAENGATAHELMSIFGWLTLKEAERYTRAAERKRLAERGMGRLVPIRPGTQSV